MKAIVYTLIIMLAYGCKTVSKKSPSILPGAYRLLSKKIKGHTTDSVADGINQLKIYTEDYFMYAAVNTHDTVASFAIGTYTAEGHNLTEHLLFSANGINRLEPVNTIFNVNKTAEGYEQIMTDNGSKPEEKLSYIEQYKYVGTKTKSIIDGVWKQIEIYSVKEKDTTWDKGTNYKICYDGYVIWGDFHMNPSNQKHITYMGFGTIEANGKDKVKEFYLKSNYTINEGKTFYIDIEFRNKDVFKQTILDSSTNTRYIEVYQRLSKP